MTIEWTGGDQIRRDMAAREFQSVGLSPKAAEALMNVGVLSLRDFLEEPWSDEEAGRRFASLSWRLSVSPNRTPRLLSHIESCRAQLLRERNVA